MEVVQIGKLIYTEFLGSQIALLRKTCDPVRPNTSNMPKAGPDRRR